MYSIVSRFEHLGPTYTLLGSLQPHICRSLMLHPPEFDWRR